MFADKAGAYLSEALSSTPIKGRLLASTTNIRLGWKGLPETNTLLLRKSINYGRNKFYYTDPRSACTGFIVPAEIFDVTGNPY